MMHSLLSALQDPALYDHPVSGFEVIETHISWVLLTGPFAYKIRKPVNFGFVDFSTLPRRLDDCREELRLNRRLAPELYTGLVALCGTPDHPRWVAAEGVDDVFEYAVKMHQFPQSSLLSNRDRQGRLRCDQLLPLAEQLAAFHRRAPSAPLESHYGSGGTLQAVIEANFQHIRPRLRLAEDRRQLAGLERWSREEFAQRRPLIEARRAAGHIRECHGDLHLGNIIIQDGRLYPFDCIEFNPDYRWIDTLNDLAFLLMDLDVRGRDSDARLLLDRYLQFSGDYSGLPLQRLFKSYRALVRAKVTLLSTEQPDDTLLAAYHRYSDLAQGYAEHRSPRLILMHGVSGSGKSWLARGLLERTALVRLRSDVVRRFTQTDSATQRYSPQAVHQVYRQLAVLAEQLLEAGQGVIVDATFLQRQQRRPFIELAERLGMPLTIIRCSADRQCCRNRIEARRQAGEDVSEATPAVLETQLQTEEPLNPSEAAHSLKIDTDQVDWPKLLARLGE